MGQEKQDEKHRNPKKVEKRKQIIEAANRIIIQKGVDKTSLSDIAAEAGISKGSLYYYYPSKDDLIFDITEKHINEISEDIFQIIEEHRKSATPACILKILFTRVLNAKMRARLHLYLIQQTLTGNKKLASRFRKKYREWSEMICNGLRKIEPSINDQTGVSFLIIALLDGFLIQSLLGLEIISPDEVVRYINLQVENNEDKFSQENH